MSIAVTDLLPSAKFLETDASGDINEVLATSASTASLTLDGILFTAEEAGADGNDISIEIIDSVGSGGVDISNSGNAITISLQESADQYSRAGFITEWDNNAPSSVTDLVSASASSSGNLSAGGQSATNLSSGADATDGTLDGNSTYLLVKSSDIFDYDGPSEQADGRKVFWGLLETASTNYNGLSSKPSKLTIDRGNLVMLSDSELRRTYTITAFLTVNDSDLSDES